MYRFHDSSDIDSNALPNVKNNSATPLNQLNEVPVNSPDCLKKESNTSFPLECRKSIDRIYQLMNKNDLGAQISVSKTKNLNIDTATVECSGNESESGTSLKHQISSNPSSFSFDKPNNEVPPERTDTKQNVVPKVIISSKLPIPQTIKNNDVEQHKKDRKLNNTKILDKNNPLKAISQLLHEFENVQRYRTKPRTEQKSLKNTETLPNPNTKQNPQKFRSRLEHTATLDVAAKVPAAKVPITLDNAKIPYQQIPFDAKMTQKCARKKMNEIFDEAKEARGEAVKGPPRFNSRLNSLAQPKKSYVQAHSEEYQSRYGRNFITDRLQRLAGTHPPPIFDRTPRLQNYTTRHNKGKRVGNQGGSPVSMRNQTGLSIEKGSKPRHNSPDQNKQALVVGQSYKHTNVPEPSQIFKKDRKMVAVESYVKNHYGRSSPIADDKPQKSRAPVLPCDIFTGSTSNTSMLQKSTEVGNKLHVIIESMLKGSPAKTLESLSECLEDTTSSRNNAGTDDFSLNICSSQCGEIISIESEDAYKTEDCNSVVTNSGNVTKEEHQITTSECIDLKIYDKQLSKSATAIDKTVGVLTTRVSLVALSDNGKKNKNNLTPKSSIQKILLLQSGDTGAPIVKLDLSRKLSEKLSKLKHIRTLSNPSWNFPLISEPITLAYVLPNYEKGKCQGLISSSLTQIFKQVSPESLLKCASISQNMVGITVKDNKTLLNLLETCATDNKHCGNNKNLKCEQTAQVELLNPNTLKNLNENENSWPINKPLVANENKATVTKEEIEKETTVTKEEIEKETTVTKKEIEKKANQTQTSVQEKNESEIASKNSETADYTTSLDILMGLLNEIQKITTCQNSYITKNKSECSKELEKILNNTPGTVNSIRSSYNFSISSLDKLRCFESNQSVYSFYISDNDMLYDGSDFKPVLNSPFATHNLVYKPICVDKEVAANIAKTEYKDKLVNVPSTFLLTNSSQSNNGPCVLLEKLCQTANQSVLNATNCNPQYSYDTSSKSNSSEPNPNNIIDVVPQENARGSTFKNHSDLKKGGDKKSLKPKTRSTKTYVIVKNKKSAPNADLDLCVDNVRFDPVMKLKRDVLVTIYSMLVLTVFAALSFPEMLYYVV